MIKYVAVGRHMSNTKQERQKIQIKLKKLDGPFLWMGFNCLKARAVRYILGISILVFQNLLAKLNTQNMYEILPSVKLQTKTTT